MEAAIKVLVDSEAKKQSTPKELMQAMINDCFFSELKCPICNMLRNRLEVSPGNAGGEIPADETSVALELEQSNLVKQQFLRLKQPNFLVGRKFQSSSTLPNEVDQNMGVLLQSDNPRMTQGQAELLASLDDRRGSRQSETSEQISFEKALSLRYGLHQLILEVERAQNHRQVFSRLTPMEIRSLLAQITCKEALYKEVEADGAMSSSQRLLRIEQELNDLMSKEESLNAQSSRRMSSMAGTTSVSLVKKSSHDQNYSN